MVRRTTVLGMAMIAALGAAAGLLYGGRGPLRHIGGLWCAGGRDGNDFYLNLEEDGTASLQVVDRVGGSRYFPARWLVAATSNSDAVLGLPDGTLSCGGYQTGEESSSQRLLVTGCAYFARNGLLAAYPLPYVWQRLTK